MSEIRCPMCGKPNPAELDVCQFCEARLKPLIISPTPDESPQTSQEQYQSHQEIKSESEVEPTDWLSGLREDEILQEGEPQEESQSEFDDETPEWLARIRTDQDSEGGTESEGIESISPFDGSSQGDLTNQDEIPEWITGLISDNKVPVDSWDEEDTGEQESEVPEWLQRLRERRVEESEQELESPLLPEEEQPSELSIDESFPQGPSDDEDTEVSQVEEGVTLESFGKAGTDEDHLLPEEEPDWVAKLTNDRVENQSTDQDDTELDWESSKGKEDIPSWLQELGGDEAEPLPEDQSQTTPEGFPETLGELLKEEGTETQEESLEQISPFLEEGEMPDWLKEPPPDVEETPSESKTVDDVQEEKPNEKSSVEEDEVEFVHASDFPDWLGTDLTEDEQPEEPTPEPELSPGEIPSWLEAMRPVEDAAPKAPIEIETPDTLETAGPLAGLRGVLSAPVEMASVQKPPIYSTKVHVTESQQSHAELLATIIAKEGKSEPIPHSPSVTPQLILRWVIALVLLLTVLWPIVTDSQVSMLPLLTSDILDVNDIINDLPANSRVLLAFDYQPSLSGEMDAAASAVIDHLMIRGAYLTLVSTSTSGPIVGEHFLEKTQASHGYTNGNQYINLGYIPGGSSGLLSFAENPQITLPYTLDSQDAWGRAGDQPLPPLQGITGIIDFSLVMVMTDNPETARTWIEQVGPLLSSDDKSTPLIMVASAQAEPLIRPYYESNPKQIQGLIAGLQGGAAYSQLTGRGELPRKYWDAFSLGLIIATLLIVAGGIYTSMITTLQSDKQVEGQE